MSGQARINVSSGGLQKLTNVFCPRPKKHRPALGSCLKYPEGRGGGEAALSSVAPLQRADFGGLKIFTSCCCGRRHPKLEAINSPSCQFCPFVSGGKCQCEYVCLMVLPNGKNRLPDTVSWLLGISTSFLHLLAEHRSYICR